MKIYKPQNVIVHKNGIGFLGALTLLFIALKLTGFITWSWLWVLSPLWLPFAIVFGIFILILTGMFIHESYKDHNRKQKKRLDDQF